MKIGQFLQQALGLDFDKELLPNTTVVQEEKKEDVKKEEVKKEEPSESEKQIAELQKKIEELQAANLSLLTGTQQQEEKSVEDLIYDLYKSSRGGIEDGTDNT